MNWLRTRRIRRAPAQHVDLAIRFPSGLLVIGWSAAAEPTIKFEVESGEMLLVAPAMFRRIDLNEQGIAGTGIIAFLDDCLLQPDGAIAGSGLIPSNMSEARDLAAHDYLWLHTMLGDAGWARTVVPALSRERHNMIAATQADLAFASEFFDAEFYFERYHDFSTREIASLTHWFAYGRAEGRTPHPLFDAEWYAREYGVPQADALGHYLQHGWIVGHEPSPLVDSQAVFKGQPTALNQVLCPLVFLCQELAAGRDIDSGRVCTDRIRIFVTDTPLQALSRYVTSGWNSPIPESVALSTPNEILEKTVRALGSRSAKPNVTPVSVLIPIAGLSDVVRQTLLVVAEALRIDHGHEVLVGLDGCGEFEDEVQSLFRASGVEPTFLKTQTRVGFAGMINMLAGKTTEERHLLWLNSDCLILPETIGRLTAHLENDASLASVTALTNHGSIASFPIFNRPFAGVASGDILQIAETAALVGGKLVIDLPTCVGHCVLVSRDAWQRVGPLNETRYPKGYGEENDWSLRAATFGLRHVLALDAYVWHQGSGTFGEEKRSLLRVGLQALNEDYLEYAETIRLSLEGLSSSLSLAFARIEAGLIKSSRGDDARLVVTHSMGGGVVTFVRDEVGYDWNRDVLLELDSRSESFTVFAQGVFTPNLGGWRKTLGVRYLPEILSVLSPTSIDVHSIVSPAATEAVWALLRSRASQRVFLHDFSCVCPRIYLVGGGQPEPRFCDGETDSERCNSCISVHGNKMGITDVAKWRSLTAAWLTAAESIVTPSASTSALMRRWGIESQVWEHVDRHSLGLSDRDQELRLVPRGESMSRHGVVRRPRLDRSVPDVLVVGSISKVKGAQLVARVSMLNRVLGSPLVLGLLGNFDESVGKIPEIFDLYLGVYRSGFRLKFGDPGLIWLPSQWPETFMYTVEDAANLAPGAKVLMSSLCSEAAQRASGYGLFPHLVEGDDPRSVLRALIALTAGEGGVVT